MALSNAEKQRRWRDKRNEQAVALTGKPAEIAENILRELGVDQARKVSRALAKRLRNIKPDCPGCKGTGWRQIELSIEHLPRKDRAQGVGPIITVPCDCG